MKPLRIKKRTSETGAAEPNAVPITTATDTAPSTAGPTDDISADPPALVPSPPPSRSSRADPLPSAHHSGRPSSSSSATTHHSAEGRAGVKFASELDNANVEAYLEYLTRPHTSWDGASRHLAHRREVIDNHRASVLARSLGSSRSTSLASTMRSDGGGRDALEMSATMSSVASAPAGFPRTAANGSKTQTGTLRKGRLGDANTVPAPPSLVATGSATSSALLPVSSSGVGSSSRATSSHSSVSTAQKAPASSKGRLSRGGALAGSRATHASPSSAGATGGVAPGPSLVVGGTQLQTSSTSLFVGGVPNTAPASRSASRDGAGGARRDSKGKTKGGRNAGSA